MCSAKEKCTQPKGKHRLYVEIAYMAIFHINFNSYHKYNKNLCVQLDTSTDVNLMPESVYKPCIQ